MAITDPNIKELSISLALFINIKRWKQPTGAAIVSRRGGSCAFSTACNFLNNPDKVHPPISNGNINYRITARLRYLPWLSIINPSSIKSLRIALISFSPAPRAISGAFKSKEIFLASSQSR